MVGNVGVLGVAVGELGVLGEVGEVGVGVNEVIFVGPPPETINS